MRVRIIENEPDLVWLMRSFLEREGMQVEATVSHFEDLFDAAAWEGIDVALVDLLLGSEITGQDVLAWLRDTQPHIKRVVLSAVTSLHPEVEELADAVATKPVDPRHLLGLLGVANA